VVSQTVVCCTTGMFSYDEETRQVWFNPFSLENENQYQLVGMVILLENVVVMVVMITMMI